MLEEGLTAKPGIALRTLPEQPIRRSALKYHSSKVKSAESLRNACGDIRQNGNAGCPTGFAYTDFSDLLGNPNSPAQLVSYDPNGPEIRPAGEYLVGAVSIYYGEKHALPQRIAAYARENGVINIRNTVVEYQRIVEEKEQTKTKASYRTLPLTQEITDYLKRLQRTQQDNRDFFGSGYIENNFVYKRETGEPFKPNYITERFIKIIRKHDLPKIRFHDLRHSAASLLLANDFSLKEIQEYLGHGDISTTATIYGHLLFKAKQNMADRMDFVLQTG